MDQFKTFHNLNYIPEVVQFTLKVYLSVYYMKTSIPTEVYNTVIHLKQNTKYILDK